MVATIIIACVTFALIALSAFTLPTIKIKKIKFDTYWVIALIGAIVLLIVNLAPINDVFEAIFSKNAINPIKILVLFFSMTIISIYLDELGFFKFLAVKATKLSKSSQYGLFLIIYFLTAILTMFTSNDVVILTLTPFIIFFCKNSDIDPMPYLIGEFAAANTWSMMFIIGNPTNIYLATSNNITFLEYFKVMAIPTLLAGIVELMIIFLIFRKKLAKKINVSNIEDAKLTNKLDVIIALIHLIGCLIFLVLSSYIPGIEMYFISLIAMCSLLTCSLIVRVITRTHFEYLGHSFKRLPYALIPFFLSMFVIVVAFQKQDVSTHFSSFLNMINPLWSYGISSFVVANVMNNIPMSIFYTTLTSSLEGSLKSIAIYASIIGSNIGALFTPLGALAGIMFSSLVRKKGVRFSFLDFFKYGSIISIPTLLIALLGLFIANLL
jgi:arsenical pump membrane protein